MIAVAVLIASVTLLLMWKDARPLLDRLVTVHEQRYARADSTPSEPMPDHLAQMAQDQGSEWATEDMMGALRESYAELGDWTKVAAAFTETPGTVVDHQRIRL